MERRKDVDVGSDYYGHCQKREKLLRRSFCKQGAVVKRGWL